MAFFPLVARKQLICQRYQDITIVVHVVPHLELLPCSLYLDYMGVLLRQPGDSA